MATLTCPSCGAAVGREATECPVCRAVLDAPQPGDKPRAA